MPPTVERRRRGFVRGRGRTILLVSVLALIVLAMSLKGIATFYTDFLWFRSLGYTDVWRGVLGARVVLALIFIGLFFALCWVNLLIADRIAPVFRPQAPVVLASLGGAPVDEAASKEAGKEKSARVAMVGTKPPAPREDSPSAAAATGSASATGVSTSCAIRSPGSTRKTSAGSAFKSSTRSSPR